MTRLLNTLTLAAALTLAIAPANAVNFAIGNFATELQQAHTCTLNEAKGVVVHNRVKPIVTLPGGNGVFRFIGTSYDTGKYVGAAVAVSGCDFTLISEIGMNHPWCEYLPSVSQRCPTSFSQD